MTEERYATEIAPGMWAFSNKPERLLREALRHPLGSPERKRLMKESWDLSMTFARQRTEDILAINKTRSVPSRKKKVSRISENSGVNFWTGILFGILIGVVLAMPTALAAVLVVLKGLL